MVDYSNDPLTKAIKSDPAVSALFYELAAGQTTIDLLSLRKILKQMKADKRRRKQTRQIARRLDSALIEQVPIERDRLQFANAKARLKMVREAIHKSSMSGVNQSVQRQRDSRHRN